MGWEYPLFAHANIPNNKHKINLKNKTLPLKVIMGLL